MVNYTLDSTTLLFAALAAGRTTFLSTGVSSIVLRYLAERQYLSVLRRSAGHRRSAGPDARARSLSPECYGGSPTVRRLHKDFAAELLDQELDQLQSQP